MELDDSRPKAQSVLIIDPALKSRAGHHLNFTKALAAIATNQGWEVRILASRWIARDLRDELGARACFHHTLYHRRDWTKLGFKRHSFAFAEILRHQIVRWRTLPSVVIFPCCDQVQYNGLARLMASLKLDWQPAIFAWHMLPPRPDLALDDVAAAPQMVEYKTAFQQIKSAMGKKGAFFIATETTSLADTFRELSGHPVTLLRSPSLLEGFTRPEGQDLLNPIHIVITGHANLSKGYGLLQAAVSNLLQKRPTLRITIHGAVSGTPNPAAMIKMLEGIKQAGPGVEILTGALDTERYYQLLRSASLLLLPYDPRAYRNKGSGIFDESLILGIPTIAPINCEFAADAINDGRAIGIKAHTPSAISDAIVAAVDSYNQLVEKTRSYALQLEEMKSSRRFVSAILSASKDADFPNLKEGIWQKPWRRLKYLTGAILSVLP